MHKYGTLAIILLISSISFGSEIHLDLEEIQSAAIKEYKEATKDKAATADKVVLLEMAEISGMFAVDHTMMAVLLKPSKNAPLFNLHWAIGYGLNGERTKLLLSINGAGEYNIYSPVIEASFAADATSDERRKHIEALQKDKNIESIEVNQKTGDVLITPKNPFQLFEVYEALLETSAFLHLDFKNVFMDRDVTKLPAKELNAKEVVLSDRNLELRISLVKQVFTSDIHLGPPFNIYTKGSPFHKEYIASA
ncbi:MAG: hypothetical protein KDD37_10510, partial [Bdellovibrionales bacterium]|nr:hypothetical protein [Bdellovibrionales bacterium]